MKNALTRTEPLFAAQAEGIITLPDNLVTARDTLARITAHPMPDPGPEEADVVYEIAAAFVAGTGPLDLAPALDARRAHETAGLARRAHDTARDLAETEFIAAVQSTVDVVIVNHLRPVFQATVERIVALHAKLAGVTGDTPPAVLLRAPKATRDAWLALEAELTTYGQMRHLRGVLLTLTGQRPENDAYGFFAEMRNADHVVPQVTSIAVDVAVRMFQQLPADPLQRVRLLLDRGAELWLPTVDEQDDLWRQVFAERIESQRQRQWRQVQARGMGELMAGTR